jgi:DNA-directed RNA polymerase specialized sigma24 family protein
MADWLRNLDLDLDPDRARAFDLLLRDVEDFARKVVAPNTELSGSDLAQIAVIEALQTGKLKGKTYDEAHEFLKLIVRRRNLDQKRRLRRQHSGGSIPAAGTTNCCWTNSRMRMCFRIER